MDPDCPYCRRRGNPCIRHGADPDYNLQLQRNLDKRCISCSDIFLSIGGRASYCGKCRRSFVTTPGSGRFRNYDDLPIKKTFRAVPYADSDKLKTFSDPWNCGQCRDLQSLCRLHQELTDSGQKPLRYHHFDNLGPINSMVF